MEERKHIDRLYQEKFKDFEASPREEIWKSISSRLQEREQKRPFLFFNWRRIASVAAALAVSLVAGDWFNAGQISAPVVEGNSIQEDRVTLSPGREALASETDPDPESGIGTEAIPEATSRLHQLLNLAKSAIIPGDTPVIATASPNLNTPDISEEPEQVALMEQSPEPQKTTADTPAKGTFEISTYAAPIFYGNFGSGNFLDPYLNNKSGQGEITYSYGLKIAYVVSDKIRIRSGVNKVSMSYNTNGVIYSAVMGSPASVIALDQKNIRMGDPSDNAITGTDRAGLGEISRGLLNQRMGFIEIPVELEFSLIDNKIGLNIIGGASTLILDENQVYLSAGSLSAEGQATNLNDISFSTNIGLGIDYEISEKFRLNLEPMMKYQINTFSTPSPENRPYYLGIYSGFTYKF